MSLPSPTAPLDPRPVVIVGAGALGSLIAARLARAGQPVLLLGRAAQVDAIHRHGLVLHDDQGSTRLQPPATCDVAAVAQAAVVLLCVKAADTDATARLLAPHLPPDVALVSLQNGVAHAPLLATLLQRPVGVGLVYVAAALAGPGQVQHAGGQDIVLGAVPGPAGPAAGMATLDRGLQLVQQRLQAAGFTLRRTASPLTELWKKLVVNCACNAISALAQAPYGVMAALPAVQELQQALLREAVAVAQAEGHVMDHEERLAAVQRVAQSMPQQRSSTAQDLARGRRSEIDHLNGEVLRAGARHGIATPANQALFALVKLHEAMQAVTPAPWPSPVLTAASQAPSPTGEPSHAQHAR